MTHVQWQGGQWNEYSKDDRNTNNSINSASNDIGIYATVTGTMISTLTQSSSLACGIRSKIINNLLCYKVLGARGTGHWAIADIWEEGWPGRAAMGADAQAANWSGGKEGGAGREKTAD